MNKHRRIALTALLVGLLSIAMVTPSNATMLGGEGKIVFVRHNQIYAMSKTGTNVKQITTSGKNYRPRWSPDGKRIAFIHEDSAGHKNAFVMSATGGSKSQVTTLGNVTTSPVWSPDGKTLAFAAGGQQNAFYTPSSGQVYLVNSTAPYGAPTPLTIWDSNTGSDYPYQLSAWPGTEIAWSPDGKHLAVANSSEDEGIGDYGLHQVLINNATETSARGMVYQEKEITWSGADCCGYQQFVDLDYVPNGVLGYGVKDLGDEFQWENDPHYTLEYPGFVSQLGDKAGSPSPTGQHMVFVRNGSDGTTPNIYVSKMTGSSRVMIQKDGYQPDWQPIP